MCSVLSYSYRNVFSSLRISTKKISFLTLVLKIVQLSRTRTEISSVLSHSRSKLFNSLVLVLKTAQFTQFTGRSKGCDFLMWLIPVYTPCPHLETHKAVTMTLIRLFTSKAMPQFSEDAQGSSVLYCLSILPSIPAPPPPPPHPHHPRPRPCIFLAHKARKERRGYQKSDPGGEHYYVGCLGLTRVSLPE